MFGNSLLTTTLMMINGVFYLFEL